MPPQGPAPTTGAPVGEQPGAPATTPGAEQPGAPAATPVAGAEQPGAPAVTPAMGLPGAEQPMPTDMLMTTPTATGTTEGGGISLLTIFLICLALLVVVGGFAAWWFFFRNKFGPGTGQPTAAQQAVAARRDAQMTNYAESGRSPTAQFMASYQLGDDLFDDSFSIDTETGEFLGECGVSISENIGVGEPKKVTAFEVWLFDKNDIQTVTKVLMSSHAFADTALRQRLEAKGETLEALPGQEFVLETQTLQMVARVTNMQYGAGAMPDESFFENMLLELAVFKKDA
jgi:hypothetical protein